VRRIVFVVTAVLALTVPAAVGAKLTAQGGSAPAISPQSSEGVHVPGHVKCGGNYGSLAANL
jgi:hypothetical protein